MYAGYLNFLILLFFFLDKELSHDLEHLKHFEEFLKNVQSDQIDEIETQNHVTAKCKSEQDSYNDLKRKRVYFEIVITVFLKL